MNWYLQALSKYATFDGRARRKEYWLFVLFSYILGFAIALVESILGGGAGETMGMLSGLFWLAMLIPSIAVGVRRMHDSDHSGWWILVPLLNLYYCLIEGTRGNNRFGPDPKAGER